MVIEIANTEICLTNCSAQSGHQIAWFAYFVVLLSLFNQGINDRI